MLHAQFLTIFLFLHNGKRFCLERTMKYFFPYERKNFKESCYQRETEYIKAQMPEGRGQRRQPLSNWINLYLALFSWVRFIWITRCLFSSRFAHNVAVCLKDWKGNWSMHLSKIPCLGNKIIHLSVTWNLEHDCSSSHNLNNTQMEILFYMQCLSKLQLQGQPQKEMRASLILLENWFKNKRKIYFKLE